MKTFYFNSPTYVPSGSPLDAQGQNIKIEISDDGKVTCYFLTWNQSVYKPAYDWKKLDRYFTNEEMANAIDELKAN